jgi:dTDP-4-dehydrorhamnose reductase
VQKKLLITGGSGLLAVNWAHKVNGNYQVVLALHRRKISIVGIETIDIHELKECHSSDIDIVINTIGLTSVEVCQENPNFAYETNVKTISNIANFCKDNNIKLVHISTDHLFDGTQSYYSEEDKPVPINVYARTKSEAEQLVMNVYPDTLVIRTNFFGNGTNYRQSFSDTILEALQNNQEIELFNDVFFTPILIDELVKKVHQLISIKATGIFNVVGNERLSKYEFGLQLAKVFGLNNTLIKPISISDRQGLVARPRDMSLSNVKLRRILKQNLPSLTKQLEALKDQDDNRILLKNLE